MAVRDVNVDAAARFRKRMLSTLLLLLAAFLLYDQSLGTGHVFNSFSSGQDASQTLVTGRPREKEDDDDSPRNPRTLALATDGITRVPARVNTASPAATVQEDGGEACPLGLCKPFIVRSGSLFVQLRPDAVREPEIFRTGAVFSDPKVGPQPFYAFPDTVENVIIDVGTNMDPDSITDFWSNTTMGFLWFEPQKTLLTHPMNLPETRKTMSLDSNRVVGFPAAVAPTNGMMKLFISATHGCTSLLPMNPKALEDPAVMKDSFRGGDRTFQDFSTSKIGFVNCIKKGDREFDWVPTLKGTDIARMIHPKHNIVYLSVDAQGFDMQVAASFGQHLKRAHILLLECQDLPPGHGMFLTQGAFSCAEIRHCIETHLPHRMIAGATGEIAETCTINNPSEERNCLFRLMDKPYFNLQKLPYLIKRDAYKLRYGIRDGLQCPSFDDV